MITYTNRLDMYPGAVPIVIHLGQYDSDFSLVFNLFSSAGTFTVESSTTAEIRGTKKDGYGYSANATIDITNKKVTVTGHQQMTACAGQNPFELVLKKSNKVLSTANFILDVEPAAMDAGTIMDASVLKELNAIIEGAATATQAAEDASDEADRAEAAADSVSESAAQITQNAEDISDLQDGLSDLTEVVDNFEGISEDVKVALLDVVSHIALWTDGQGQDYYDALYDALYKDTYPDLTTGEVVYGYYLDAEGNAVASNGNFYNEKYFTLSPNTTYVWVRGFDGFARKSNNVIYADALAYRVCYYDSNKEFISREVSEYSDELGYIEARYLEFNPPSNAAYFRVSWTRNPVGKIYRSIPNNLYAVTLILANLNDANISADANLMSKVTFIRDGVNVFYDVVYGRPDINLADYYGEIPNNNSTGGATFNTSMWFRNVFNCNAGHSPEESGTHAPNPDTTTRIQNRSSFLMKKGDIIRFTGVKAGVRAERIYDGYVQHTTAWITTDTDFVVGGEE